MPSIAQIVEFLRREFPQNKCIVGANRNPANERGALEIVR